MFTETLPGQTAGFAGRRAGGLSNTSLEYRFDQTYHSLTVSLSLRRMAFTDGNTLSDSRRFKRAFEGWNFSTSS